MPNCTRIEIVGLGLAGACLLRALAHARFEGEVVVYELASEPAQGASGNPVGIVHPLRSADHNLGSQFFDLGLATCLRWTEELGGVSQGWAAFNGVREQEERTGGLSIEQSPGGWIQPIALVKACLESAQAWFGARLILHFQTAAPEQGSATRVCCSASPKALIESGLCLLPVAGQVSWVAAEPDEGPAQVLCGTGYVAPVVQGRLVVGASFERESVQVEVTQQGHAENLERLHQLDTDLAQRVRSRWSQAQGRASVRWAARDRLPLIGQPVDLAALKNHPHPQRLSQLHHLPRLERTWLLMGLGSRGLSTAPLGAEAIVAALLDLPSPLPSRLADAVDPARFVLREHRRGA
ncbi:MAG: tRNA 5-methylaminomethyl-2-thiouridine biosynthesis protein MnmC [Pseudomonadota bacterium]|jgi:tRNA 5-methylaminomethyl-2-thiouridine biosynthesis bifunctional protein